MLIRKVIAEVLMPDRTIKRASVDVLCEHENIPDELVIIKAIMALSEKGYQIIHNSDIFVQEGGINIPESKPKCKTQCNWNKFIEDGGEIEYTEQ